MTRGVQPVLLAACLLLAALAGYAGANGTSVALLGDEESVAVAFEASVAPDAPVVDDPPTRLTGFQHQGAPGTETTDPGGDVTDDGNRTAGPTDNGSAPPATGPDEDQKQTPTPTPGTPSGDEGAAPAATAAGGEEPDSTTTTDAPTTVEPGSDASTPTGDTSESEGDGEGATPTPESTDGEPTPAPDTDSNDGDSAETPTADQSGAAQ